MKNMGLFDFFKKTAKPSSTEDKPKLSKRVSFEELMFILTQETENAEKSIDSIKKELQNKVTDLSFKLKEQQEIIKTVSVDERKEPERVKILVKENLANYILYTEKLISSLEDLPWFKSTTQQCVIELQDKINLYKKNSFPSYEKASILVGREIETQERMIKEFVKNMNMLLETKKDEFSRLSKIAQIQSLSHEIKETKSALSVVKKDKESLQKEEQDAEQAYERITAEYDNFKSAPPYKEYASSLLQKDRIKQALQLEASSIKDKINLKEIIKKMHGSIDKKELLSSYREKFLDTLLLDQDLVLADIAQTYANQDIKLELISLREKLIMIEEKKFTSVIDQVNEYEKSIRSQLTVLESSRKANEEGARREERLTDKLNELMATLKMYASPLFGGLIIYI